MFEKRECVVFYKEGNLSFTNMFRFRAESDVFEAVDQLVQRMAPGVLATRKNCNKCLYYCNNKLN